MASSSQGDWYTKLIKDDLKFIKKLDKRLKKSNVSFYKLMHIIVNKNPRKDICIIIWIIHIIGLYFIGFNHYFIVFLNMLLVMILRNFLVITIPFDYDIKLFPLTDLNLDNRAFPSLESYMGTVVLLDFSLYFNRLYIYILCIFLLMLVGFSRVFSRAKFPHQIIASSLLGIIGWIIVLLIYHLSSVHK